MGLVGQAPAADAHSVGRPSTSISTQIVSAGAAKHGAADNLASHALLDAMDESEPCADAPQGRSHRLDPDSNPLQLCSVAMFYRTLRLASSSASALAAASASAAALASASAARRASSFLRAFSALRASSRSAWVSLN